MVDDNPFFGFDSRKITENELQYTPMEHIDFSRIAAIAVDVLRPSETFTYHGVEVEITITKLVTAIKVEILFHESDDSISMLIGIIGRNIKMIITHELEKCINA